MRILITFGSKMGGTAGIADTLGGALQDLGYDVVVAAASRRLSVVDFDAFVIGGALYANRWHKDARRFVAGNRAVLARSPVWLFSSGPLDDSAAVEVIPPTKQVRRLLAEIGARGHMTFGGRLRPDARGFPAAAMARENAGDWRDKSQIRQWAESIADALALEADTLVGPSA